MTHFKYSLHAKSPSGSVACVDWGVGIVMGSNPTLNSVTRLLRYGR